MDVDLIDVDEEGHTFDTGRASFDLLRAAALLARVRGAPPDLEALERQVVRWARAVAERLDQSDAVSCLQDVLAGDAGLRGDRAAYDDPDNSFLDRVITRRRGLPIALAILWHAVAERAGIVTHPLALPGHVYLAVSVQKDRFAVLDPFKGGVGVTLEELAGRCGIDASEVGEVLQPAAPRQLLFRMLVNLRGSYARRQQHAPLCRVLSRMILLQPQNPQLFLERAEVRRLLWDVDGARMDLAAARLVAPLDRDVEATASHLEAVLLSDATIH